MNLYLHFLSLGLIFSVEELGAHLYGRTAAFISFHESTYLFIPSTSLFIYTHPFISSSNIHPSIYVLTHRSSIQICIHSLPIFSAQPLFSSLIHQSIIFNPSIYSLIPPSPSTHAYEVYICMYSSIPSLTHLSPHPLTLHPTIHSFTYFTSIHLSAYQFLSSTPYLHLSTYQCSHPFVHHPPTLPFNQSCI